MKCNICGSNITQGKKIIKNGIKYICINEDIKLCNQILKKNLEKAFIDVQLDLQNKKDKHNVSYMCKHCNYEFYPESITKNQSSQLECIYCKNYNDFYATYKK
jgi:hypothetical protein